MGTYGYERDTTPRLDAFFEDGLVVERAYSTEANTTPSVVSILSGLLPQQNRVRLLYQLVPEETKLIVDLLPESYQTAAFVSNIVLTDEATGIASRFDHFDDHIDEPVGGIGLKHKLFERDARATTDAAIRWLSTVRDSDRPLFLWVHYIDPHSPYTAPADGPARFSHAEPLYVDEKRLRRSVREVGGNDALVYVDAYDEEIAHTDAEVGRLLDQYASRWAIDDALVIFTADHGESMLEHEAWFAHGYQVYDEIVRVPLMLRGPGVSPGRQRGLGSGLDVAPTILGFAGGERPADSRGIDLRVSAIPAARSVYSEATDPLATLVGGEKTGRVGYWRTVVQGDDKWTVGMVRGQRELRERRHYDLRRDPAELEPVDEPLDSAAARELLSLIRQDPDPGGLPHKMQLGIKINAPKVDPRATEEQLEKLRALGYVE
jgi:arylsulfatase A-like enzyme